MVWPGCCGLPAERWVRHRAAPGATHGVPARESTPVLQKLVRWDCTLRPGASDPGRPPPQAELPDRGLACSGVRRHPFHRPANLTLSLVARFQNEAGPRLTTARLSESGGHAPPSAPQSLRLGLSGVDEISKVSAVRGGTEIVAAPAQGAGRPRLLAPGPGLRTGLRALSEGGCCSANGGARPRPSPEPPTARALARSPPAGGPLRPGPLACIGPIRVRGPLPRAACAALLGAPRAGTVSRPQRPRGDAGASPRADAAGAGLAGRYRKEVGADSFSRRAPGCRRLPQWTRHRCRRRRAAGPRPLHSPPLPPGPSSPMDSTPSRLSPRTMKALVIEVGFGPPPQGSSWPTSAAGRGARRDIVRSSTTRRAAAQSAPCYPPCYPITAPPSRAGAGSPTPAAGRGSRHDFATPL